jgi:WD40 repeat protein
VGKRSFAIPNNIRNGDREVLDAPGHSGRVAITAMAAFGSTAVATGGVDGSVFLAHTIQFGEEKKSNFVNGLKLQWGMKGDGNEDIGSGSVSCLVAAKGAGYRFGGPDNTVKNPDSSPDDDDVLAAVDGCRVIAGMTSGGLRVWSLKDIYQAGYMMRNETESPSHFSSGGDDFGMKEAVAGVAIGGHRGGVTCIDVPPAMYRPDSLISGGEDGLIKLWSLKSSPTSDQTGAQSPQRQSRFFNSRQIVPVAPINFDVSDAQVLTGHQGRIICIKTAWHGDKLLSGGADKTVRLWDLSGSTGNPLSTFQGHQGIVTQTHFWGPNTIVSASTDRSIALWDTRAGSSPIFALRHHLAPVSDLILGNRSEPLMISAGADGSLATWDFRVLSGKSGDGPDQNAEAEKPHSSRTVRTPIMKMNHIEQTRRANNCGSVKLSRAVGRDDFSFLSASDDGIVNEWEASSGRKLSSHYTGHKDALSGFEVYSSKDGMRQNRKIGVNAPIGGVVSCSWDGTVRLRRLSRKPAR